MKLNEKLNRDADNYTIVEFMKNHPEVYGWFQGDYFAEQMITKREFNIRAYRVLDRDGNKEHTIGLPIQDSNGVLDLDIIVNYLKAEGLVAYVGSQYVDTKDLIIRLK